MTPKASARRTTPGSAAGLFGSRSTLLFVVVICLACHAFWQGHGVLDPAFRNPDVAGITYDARTLLRGGLPYVDSVEIKPPGAFYLFTPWLALGGMRAVWAAAVLWGTSLSLATGLLAGRVWGPKAAARAAVLHAACAAIASDGDINYSFWMATPFTVAALCACAGTLTRSERRASVLWLASGASALLAVAIKPSAWPLGFLFAALIGRDVLAGRYARAGRAVGLGVLGAASLAGLLALPYAYAGKLDSLVLGLAEVERFGHEYVGIVTRALGGRARAIVAGLPCLVEQLPGLLALAVLGAAELFPRRIPRPPLALGAWVFAGVALVGVTYTLRFYSHDNAQLWPALAVLAVRPAGLIARALDGIERIPALGPPVTLGLGLLAAWPGFEERWGFVHWMGDRDHQIAELCRELEPHLPAGEPVLAWGWSAWSVYEHCGRPAPGRVFKVIATVTTVNTNTCNHGFGPMRLAPEPGPQEFLSEIERNPPALFLWSSYFKEMGGDPLEDFAPLRALLEFRYKAVAARGPYVALLRRDLLPEESEVLTQRAAPDGRSPVRDAEPSVSRAGSVWTSTSQTPVKRALMASVTECATR